MSNFNVSGKLAVVTGAAGGIGMAVCRQLGGAGATIALVDINEETEEVIGVKIDSFFSKIDPKVVRIPKNKIKEIEKLKNVLKNKLGVDSTSNIAAVLNLLKELLQ